MMPDYRNHCTDCMPIISAFPANCAAELGKAFLEFVSTGTVADVKCAVHCAETVQWWGVGLWVGDHPLDQVPMFGDDKSLLTAAAAELDRVKGHSAGVTAASLNWSLIVTAAIKLLELLLTELFK